MLSPSSEEENDMRSLFCPRKDVSISRSDVVRSGLMFRESSSSGKNLRWEGGVTTEEVVMGQMVTSVKGEMVPNNVPLGMNIGTGVKFASWNV